MLYNLHIKEYKEIKMPIDFKEPRAPRYIFVNPKTNKVHLFVPVFGGGEITTDNTCKTFQNLRDFMDKNPSANSPPTAMQELTKYAEALEFDLQFLADNDPQKQLKRERLDQINIYISYLKEMGATLLGSNLNRQIQISSNVYGMQLKPKHRDPMLNAVNVVFHVNLHQSTLYNALYEEFAKLEEVPSPKDQFQKAVLAALNEQSAQLSFEQIKEIFDNKCKSLLNLKIDYSQPIIGYPDMYPNKETIDMFAGYDPDDEDAVSPTNEEYLRILVNSCIQDAEFDKIPVPPFYRDKSHPNREIGTELRQERLSILTQFFLAHVNIYCKINRISGKDFGKQLDSSPKLCQELASIVGSTIVSHGNVEEALIRYINTNSTEFGLNRQLNTSDKNAIIKKFTDTYNTISESQHMDEFMILDSDHPGLFAAHQGSICIDFAQIGNGKYFEEIRQDYKILPVYIPANQCGGGSVAINIDTIIKGLKNEAQLANLPQQIQEQVKQSPNFVARMFLQDIAQGKQTEAENRLKLMQDSNIQEFLQTPTVFTDYSGRTFNCTAYEYAYWAKDVHMCHMLERYMSDATKESTLARIKNMEQSKGLTYEQNGQQFLSMHFSLEPLIKALETYKKAFEDYKQNRQSEELKLKKDEAWQAIGRAQRDVPAHVAQEYCRKDRNFVINDQSFKEESFPRTLVISGSTNSWFPLSNDPNTGLGIDYSFCREAQPECLALNCNNSSWSKPIEKEIQALQLLDHVRTQGLEHLQERLHTPEAQQSQHIVAASR